METLGCGSFSVRTNALLDLVPNVKFDFAIVISGFLAADESFLELHAALSPLSLRSMHVYGLGDEVVDPERRSMVVGRWRMIFGW